MVNKLRHQLKKKLDYMGLESKLWKCNFLYKVDGIYHFKVYYRDAKRHGEFLIWTCYFSGDHFVSESRLSQPIR